MVVLLLASGVYVALVVRKSDDSSRSTHPKAPAPPSGHQTPRTDSPGL